jgi:hypothetical protein
LYLRWVIGQEGPNESSKALGIMTVTGSSDEYAIAYHDNIVGSNSFEVAQQMAEDLKAQNPNVNMILFLASGIDIAADQAIAGMESVFGPDIPVFGASSSDNMRAISSFQMADDLIFERGAIAIGFADPTLEVITQADHGFAIVGCGAEVTRSENNRVYEVEGQPAWHWFTENIGLDADAEFFDTIPIGAVAEELSPEDAAIYGSSHVLRVIAKKDDDGSIYMPVDCPEGTRLWLTKRDEARIFAGLDRMVDGLVEACGRRPVAVFHADCGARGKHLFNRVLKDEIVSRMQVPLMQGGTVPWLGMYGLGEFAKLNGKNAFHNYTTALYVVLRKEA